MAAVATGARTNPVLTNQDWHDVLRRSFPDVPEAAGYDGDINYEKICRLFSVKKYDYKGVASLPWALIDEIREMAADQDMGVIEKGITIFLGVSIVTLISPIALIVYARSDISEYQEHRRADPNEYCPCSSCQYQEQLLFDDIIIRTGKAYTRISNLLLSCDAVSPLRRDHFYLDKAMPSARHVHLVPSWNSGVDKEIAEQKRG